MELIGGGNNFSIFSEDTGGKTWIHIEFNIFTTGVYRELLREVDRLSGEMDEVYCSIAQDNIKMRRLVSHVGFIHICNIRTKDGVRAIHWLETRYAKRKRSSAECTQ